MAHLFNQMLDPNNPMYQLFQQLTGQGQGQTPQLGQNAQMLLHPQRQQSPDTNPIRGNVPLQAGGAPAAPRSIHPLQNLAASGIPPRRVA